MNTAIAKHLNIAETLIAEVQEWAHVLWVRFVSGRPTFVSKKVVKMERQAISGIEWANRFAALWNSTVGSEWCSNAGGFVKANVWSKKEDEILIYLGSNVGFVSLKKMGAEIKLSVGKIKYNLGEQVASACKTVASEYTIGEFKPVKRVVWYDEDGNEVDPNEHPAEAVIRREIY